MANGGSAGSISVTNNSTTSGAIALGALTSNSGAAFGTGAGGTASAIQVTNNAAGQNLSSGAITANGGAGLGTNQAGGNAGAVSISGSGTLTTVAITSSSGAATGTGVGGAAGGITLTGSSVSSGALTSSGGANGSGGNVSVTALLANLAVGAIAANGGTAVGLLPSRYPGSEQSADPLIRLGRATDWVAAAPETYVGAGQRMLATDGGEHALLDLRQIRFNVAPEAAEETSDDHG